MKRHLSELEKAKVWVLGGQGLVPKDIICIVCKEFANSHSTAKEIYNELGTARAKELWGRGPIEALVELISYTYYFNKVRLVGDAVNCVFFIHQSSVSMCQTFCTVFLRDCTYKTNKFGMPLLNVVGITSTYATFNASFAFLHVENEETYAWALQQFLEVVKPKVLCTNRELALMNGIAQICRGCHKSSIVGTSTRTCLLIARHASPMLSGRSSCNDGTWLSPTCQSNYPMRPLVLLRRRTRQAIWLREITLTILGCHTRRSSWHALWMSFPTLAMLVRRGWRETTT
jgi:hypothetical protein